MPSNNWLRAFEIPIRRAPSKDDLSDRLATCANSGSQDALAAHDAMTGRPVGIDPVHGATGQIDRSGNLLIVLQADRSSRKTPLAAQLTSGYSSEDRLIRARRAFQAVTAWHRARPDDRTIR